ncbi:MAG: hypothetical protein QMD22_00055 [archaeon]|nr:hypothetical protein [archaeon]
MEFEKAFGEGKTIGYRDLIEATDRIVPNEHLSRDRESLLRIFNDYTTISKYIIETFNPIEREIFLSVFEPFPEIKYNSALLKNGMTIALKAIKEGYSQYFLSDYFLEHLKQKGLSIVRFGTERENPSYFTIEVDTREREFNPAKLELKFETKTFHHEYKGSGWIERESDIITNVEGLAGVTKKAYNYIVKGTTNGWEFLIDHLRNNFSRGIAPYNLKTIIDCYYKGNDIIAGVRVHKEKGMEIFLTKEAYEYMKEQKFSILRGKRSEERNDWEELELLFHPEVAI